MQACSGILGATSRRRRRLDVAARRRVPVPRLRWVRHDGESRRAFARRLPLQQGQRQEPRAARGDRHRHRPRAEPNGAAAATAALMYTTFLGDRHE